MNIRFIILSILLLGSNCSLSFAQNWFVRPFTPPDGKTFEEVRDIKKAQDNSLWFASWGNGIAKLDGSQWQIFTTNEGLPSDFVPALEPDENNGIWASTVNGITHIQENGTVTILSKENLPIIDQNIFVDVKRLSNGEFWFGSESGSIIGMTDKTKSPSINKGGTPHIINDKQWFIVKPPSMGEGNEIYEIYEAEDKSVWLAADRSGIFRLINSQWTPIPIPNLKENERVRQIVQDAGENFWCSGSGLLNLKNGEWHKEQNVTANVMTSSPEGQLFAVDTSRVYYQSPDGWNIVNYSWEMGTPIARVIFFASANHAWIGTQEGIIELLPHRFQKINHSQGSYAATGYDFFAAPDTQPLSINNRNELVQFDGTQWNSILLLPQEFQGSRRLTGTLNGKIWASSANVLFEIDFRKKNILRTIRKPEGLSLNSLLYTSKGELYLYGNSGLYILRQDNFISFDALHQFEQEEIFSVTETPNNSLLICKRYTVERFNSGKVEKTWRDEEIHDASPFSLALESNAGETWIRLRSQGILVDSGHSQKKLSIENGILSTRLANIFESSDSTIWLATDKLGLSSYKNNRWINYSHMEGIGSEPSVSVGEYPQGTLWLSSNNYNIYHYVPDPDPPDTNIKQFSTSIPHNSFGIITFTGYDFWNHTETDDLVYSWRITGPDADSSIGHWSQFSPATSVQTPQLVPGTYNFHVKASDLDRNIDPTPASITFEVLPLPITLRLWFLPLTASIIIFTLSLSIITILSRRKLLLYSTNLEGIVAGRTAELTDTNRQLETARQAAEKANAAKSQFLANISHEIRTPISGIISMLELTLDSKLTPPLKNYLRRTYDSADSLLHIINDLLDFSKSETGKLSFIPAEFCLRDSLGDMLHAISGRGEQKNVELVLHIYTDVPDRLIGDKLRLRQVITNLIGNAIKFTETGDICLSVHIDSIEKEIVKLHFTVLDTGIGIPEEKQDLIFSPFEQADISATRKYGGTGLGLSISKKLVELMNGEMWVESPNPATANKGKDGPGSAFYFTAVFKLAQPERRISSCPEIENRSVLIIDDNEIHRDVLRHYLQTLKMKVITVPGAEEALETIKHSIHEEERFDLLLIDDQMAEVDGFTLIKDVNHIVAPKALPIIILSTVDIPLTRNPFHDLDIHSIVRKPVKESDLHNAIMNVFKPSHLEDESISSERDEYPDKDNVPLRILVVDDNEICQLAVKDRLERWNHSVTVAKDGVEVLDILNRVEIDLVLMDLHMPIMDGIATTRNIRSKEQGTQKHLPIIAMTAAAMKEDYENCLDSGMDGYISKPLKTQQLIQVISKVNESRIQPFISSHNATVNHEIVFDQEAFSREFDGNIDTIKEMVEMLGRIGPEQLELVKRAVDKQDAKALFQSAHKLKNYFAQFHAYKGLRATQDLETKGRENSFERVENCLRHLETEFRGLMHALDEFVKEN